MNALRYQIDAVGMAVDRFQGTQDWACVYTGRFRTEGLVRGGARRETIPDFHIIDPLVDGIGG